MFRQINMVISFVKINIIDYYHFNNMLCDRSYIIVRGASCLLLPEHTTYVLATRICTISNLCTPKHAVSKLLFYVIGPMAVVIGSWLHVQVSNTNLMGYFLYRCQS